MRFLVAILAFAIPLASVPVRAAPAASVNQGTVWQDTERNHRRSPSQIKNQLNLPRVGNSLPLPQNAQDARSAKTKNTLATNPPPLATTSDKMLGDGDWRLKILPAAVAPGETVLLGDIATPIGVDDTALWEKLKNIELWPAPQEEGKPLQINKSRLSQALRQALGQEYAARCILPSSLAIQKGGAVFREEDLRNYVVKSLTPQLAALPGEAELTDFKLPEYIFLAHTGQRVQLEPGKLSPGRVTMRFAVQEADGAVLRRVAGTAKLTLWITAPAAARPLNKGETLTPDGVTFTRVSASQIKDAPWDGQGGPWQLTRSIGKGETILESDLASKAMVRRGNIVTLVFSRGNVHMTIQAEALADGEPGATIPVRNLQTKKQVYATVKDGSTVEIH